jgi:hypothetical protein
LRRPSPDAGKKAAQRPAAPNWRRVTAARVRRPARRRPEMASSDAPKRSCGAAAGRAVGAELTRDTLDGISLLFCLTGACLSLACAGSGSG